MELKHAKQLKGTISIPGDKSISHRAIMFGAISEGTTEITNFLQGADCLSTISCFQKMGISIENTCDRTWQGTAWSDRSDGTFRCGKQWNDYPPDLRYSCRTVFFFYVKRRCIYPEKTDEKNPCSPIFHGSRCKKRKK